MSRENSYSKASRLLVEARLEVRLVNKDVIVGVVRGDSGEVYDVMSTPSGWSCRCPAFGRCSHIYALQRVTLRPRSAPTVPDGTVPDRVANRLEELPELAELNLTTRRDSKSSQSLAQIAEIDVRIDGNDHDTSFDGGR